jgi:hypothetical protein
MKNLFNDLSQSEKNRILEQHQGGKDLVIENFQKLLKNKPYLKMIKKNLINLKNNLLT